MAIKISEHFTAEEFACNGHNCCGGHIPDWNNPYSAAFLRRLETLRSKAYTRGMIIRSGYRCPKHNAEVGGAGNSQHKMPMIIAADIDPVVTLHDMISLGLFSGIGYRRSDKKVVHIDSGHRWFNEKGRVPVTWEYPSM